MPTFHFRALRWAARRHGWELQKQKRLDGRDVQLLQFFSFNRIDLLIDCGANRGQFGCRCREAGYRGRILSFEPVAEAFKALEARAASDSKWDTRHCALGETGGERAINVSAGDATLSSFYAAAKDLTDFELEFCKTELVSINRLDEVLAREKVPTDSVIFIKSDTQGNDLNVLEGAGSRIDQAVGLMVELSVRPLYEGTPSHWDVLDYVRGKGFEPFGFSTVTRGLRGELIEYDGLFVRGSRRSRG